MELAKSSTTVPDQRAEDSTLGMRSKEDRHKFQDCSETDFKVKKKNTENSKLKDTLHRAPTRKSPDTAERKRE